MTFISYAQNFEDVILWRALRDVRNGFYIDVGAWDHRESSVTYAFYERGWRGINIEPDAEKFACLQAARAMDINLQMAVADIEGERPFFCFPGTGLSTLNPTIAHNHSDTGLNYVEHTVRVGRLVDICNLFANSDIHFLKIDAEGAEVEVLAGADFNKHRPWIVVIEATQPNSPEMNYNAWEYIILGARYRLAYSDGLNRFYVAEEKVADLLSRFMEPINIFDDFVSVSMLRKALSIHNSGRLIAELSDEFFRLSARKDAEHSFALAAAEEKITAAEARIKAAELEAARAHAAARALTKSDSITPAREHDTVVPPGATVMTEARVKRTRTFYDAGLILYFGFSPPVGIVRVEQYVAELLARQPEIDLHFVVFDSNLREYRRVLPNEYAQLNDILFNRYRTGGAALSRVLAVSAARDETIRIRDMPVHTHFTQQRPSRLQRIATASRISADLFNEIFSRDLKQWLPIYPDHSPPRRIATRVLRRSLAGMGRIGHRILSVGRYAVDSLLGSIAYLARDDRQVTTPSTAIPADTPPADTAVIESISDKSEVGDVSPFLPGDVLITLANLWDYMDYSYLTRIVRKDGVRLISVIYDVIAMYLPFSTPAPIHIYHRHWVELGHLAESLIAISKQSRDTYRKLIAAPNDLNPSLQCAYLPNFLYERREEIGEKVVSTLIDRRFVVFCSTIETRKNHQLLLHLWERLRQDIDMEILPVLVFVGRWGWGTEAVRTLVERNWRLRDHLRILNDTSDAELIWLYRHARFTVFPSLAEGFGLAAAESLSFGTPVVVSNCPALAEATEGLMPAYDPLDLPAWLEEMRRLIQDDEYLAQQREKAAHFRGGDYNAFALAIRDAVLVNGKCGPAHADGMREEIVRG